MRYQIVTSEPSGTTAAEWQEFLTRADAPAHYASPAFFREPQFRTRAPFAILVSHGARIEAVATGLIEDGFIRCGLLSRPQLSVDPNADRHAVAETLVAAFREIKGRAVEVVAWSRLPELTRAGYRELVHDGEAGIVLLDLRRGPDALFRDFSESRRTNIRKAMRRGVEIVQASAEADFVEYYPIYAEWSRLKGHEPTPYPLFRETMQANSNRRLFLARFGGKTIAGAIVRFWPGGVVEYAANSSLKADQGLRPNDLLHWRIIEWACAEGLVTYSLGGAHLFLRRFGGTISKTYEYRLDRTFGKRLEWRDRIEAAARASWKRLPPSAQRIIGLARRRRHHSSAE